MHGGMIELCCPFRIFEDDGETGFPFLLFLYFLSLSLFVEGSFLIIIS